MERQNLDDTRVQELTQAAQQFWPPTDPPLPGTIAKVGDDLEMFGCIPVRVLGNANPGTFVGYTDPDYLSIDGYLEWPYAPEYISDRAPVNPAEPPMPVYPEEPPPEGQQQQAEGEETERQMGAGERAPRRRASVQQERQALERVLAQLTPEQRTHAVERIRTKRPELVAQERDDRELADHRHGVPPRPDRTKEPGGRP